jgi:hypothetical protein
MFWTHLLVYQCLHERLSFGDFGKTDIDLSLQVEVQGCKWEERSGTPFRLVFSQAKRRSG